MRINIVTPSLSHNCLGRAYILAKVLAKNHEVKIIGPMYPQGIWQPLNQESFSYIPLPTSPGLRSLLTIRPMIEAIEADVIYISKPLYPGMIAGLWHKYKNGTRVLVDIDDFEVAGFARLPFHHKVIQLLTFSRADAYPPFVSLTFRLIMASDAITVSSSFLQKKFGGIIVPHGRDTDFLNPVRYDRLAQKKQLGLHSAKVVMFLGTPRPHKGLETLISAVKQLNRRDVCLVLVGFPDHNPYVQQLKNLADSSVLFIEPQPFAYLPMFLAAADIMVVPQQVDTFSQGQVPAKIFDAMAMAKPIVTTTVSDLPDIMAENCGLLVEPGNVNALTAALDYLLNYPTEAELMGQRARKRAVEYYSWQAMEALLENVLHTVT